MTDGEDLENLLEQIKTQMNILLNSENQNQIADNSSTENRSETLALPSYSRPVNFNRATWNISDPVILTANPWLGTDIEGIHLSIGFYEINYTLSNITKEGGGLALFDQESKRFFKLIAWHTYNKDIFSVVHIEGTRYFEIKTSKILGLINIQGKLRPKNFPGACIVTIRKLREVPN